MKKLWILLFWFLTILGLEFLLRLCLYGSIFNSNILYLIVFSFLNAFILYVVTSVFNLKLNKIISYIFLILIVLIFLVQLVYYKIFTAFFTLDAITMAKGILPFVKTIFETLWNNIIYVLLMLLPVVIYIIINKYLDYSRNRLYVILINVLILLNILSLSVLSLNLTDVDGENYTPKKLFFDIYYPSESVKKLGLITTMSLDLNRILFDNNKTTEFTNVDNEIKNKVSEYEYNTVEIDWNKLIENESNETVKNMHKYFSNVSGTQKNEYTGMFNGKNLIFIVAESLYTPFINEDLTPNLYNIYNNGIVFNNYYPFKFPKSTTDSEYMFFTSVLPKEGANRGSATASRKNYFPYSIGNIFNDNGYKTTAFHTWNNMIYDRRTYIANYGFDYYDGPMLGIKTDMIFSTRSPNFPSSDLEMIEKSHSYYMDDELFATYYITVSGHLNYEYNINAMIRKNWKYVKDLNYSTKVKGYIACNLEFEFAIGRLLELLEENGILDDTVIVITTDHYPYGLTIKEMKELNDVEISEPFSINKSDLLIYNSKTKAKIINKVASSIDILPTLLNLFNIEYDSRLLMGNDLFSNNDGLAIFSDRSFITDYGYFNSKNNKLVIYENSNVDSVYFDNIKNIINNKFELSRNILDKNYYMKVFEKDD